MQVHLGRYAGLIGINLLCLASLLPFINKPFHIDDPLYLWTARQIVRDPLNPYGLDVNWYGWSGPIWTHINNPPLVPYYLAAISRLFGWSERAMHAAMLLPALAL